MALTRNTPASLRDYSSHLALSPERRISAGVVREICGGISDPTLDRWLKDDRKGFPRPSLIGRRRYWRLGDVVAWLDAQGANRAEVA